jgi:two-component system sensor histidine kinase ChvG
MALYEHQNDIHHEHSESRVKVEVEIKGAARAIAMGGKSPFTIEGHERRLSQVIYNLLDNAISFSPKDGKVRITCDLLRRSKEIEIAVEDEGPGIRVENLERIFERFYTDRPDQADFGNNSGLGLNISRQIVQAHKGSIWAENRMAPVGATKASEETPLRRVLGARFVIRLPAA